jgi:hypothetical protein
MATEETLRGSPRPSLSESWATRHAWAKENVGAVFVPTYSARVGRRTRYFSRAFVCATGFVWPEEYTFGRSDGYELLWRHIESIGLLCPDEAMQELAAQISTPERPVYFAARTPKHEVANQQASSIYRIWNGSVMLELLNLEAHGLVPEAEIVFMLK